MAKVCAPHQVAPAATCCAKCLHASDCCLASAVQSNAAAAMSRKREGFLLSSTRPNGDARKNQMKIREGAIRPSALD